MRMLAIVGEDGQIHLHDLDGGTDQLVAAGTARDAPSDATTIANWPTWSPDGERLAFFRYTVAGGEVREHAVCVASLDGSAARAVYTSALAAPIYLAWSPDGRRLAVLQQEGRGLYLRIIDARGGGPALTAAQGAPLYYAWLPDSQGLVAHVGVGEGLAATSRLVWIQLEGGQAVRTSVSRLPAPGFRAPSWSAARGAATVAFAAGERAELALLAGPDSVPMVLAECGRAPAFNWSPDQSYLAFAARGDDETLYTGIAVRSAADGTVRQLVEAPVLAFFWRGNAGLVYVTGDLGQRTVAVRSIGVDGGEPTDLGFVRPSRDLLLLFSHFDQYAQSVRLVSPAADAIVLAASRAQELENGQVPTIRQVLVRTLVDGGAERAIGRGRLAFWRPSAP